MILHCRQGKRFEPTDMRSSPGVAGCKGLVRKVNIEVMSVKINTTALVNGREREPTLKRDYVRDISQVDLNNGN
jgi:hypothetical protein